MFSKQVFGEVIALINDLQKTPDPEYFQEKTLSALEELFQASDSVILDWTVFLRGARTLSKEDMFFHKFEKYPGWDYPKFHRQDPIFDWIDSGRCHADLNVTRLSDLASFRDIKKTEFYSEILAPMNCRYVLTMAAHRGKEISASISMIRSKESADFSRADVQLARLITPILANAYSHLLLKKYSDLKDDIFDIVASHLQDKPYVIFSSKLESVYRSEKMTVLGRQLSKYGNSIGDIFKKSAVIGRYIDTFTSANPARYRRLPEKLTDTVSIGKNKVVHIELHSFVITPEKRYLMATLKLDNSSRSLTNLQCDYGLTQREDQIAQMAAKGINTRQIGEALAISPWSVKNHLKNIYKKTGVNNRAILAQLINALNR